MKQKRTVLISVSLSTLLFFCSTASGILADSLHPIKLNLGAQEFTMNPSCLTDGQETYVPLALLKAIGGDFKLRKSGESLYFKPYGSTREVELAIARPKGEPMIALSDVAKSLQAVVFMPDQKPSGSAKVSLLSRLLGVKYQNGELRISTSFPVPYHVRMLADTMPIRGYVDIEGCVVAAGFKPESISYSEKFAKKLSVSQNDPEIVRVVVELAQGLEFTVLDGNKNNAQQILVQTHKSVTQVIVQNPKSKQLIPASPKPEVKKVEPISKSSALVQTQSSSSLDDPAPLVNPSSPDEKPTNDSSPLSALPKTSPQPTAAGTKEPIRTSKPSRGGKSRHDAIPVDIRDLVLHSESDRVMRLDIATSGRAAAFMHYSPDSSQLIIDVPNATLRLNTADSMEQQTNHPLITALHAIQAQESPPMARIALDMSRVIGFSLAPFNDHLSVELRLPTNSTGVLADKLIVIDPGHGGSSSGALGRGDGLVYEKDVTLAIALKLRKELENAGARVVMTRDKDVDVPLYDRPRLANEIGADLFVSIHNDSNGRSNSASGTSTYYHLGDPNSRALAACVQKEVTAVSGLPSRGVLSDGIMYQNGFAVLRASKMPAVLCEVAYINNARDRAALTSSDFQQRVAQAMCDGLRNYVEGRPRAAYSPSKKSETIRVASEPAFVHAEIQVPTHIGN